MRFLLIILLALSAVHACDVGEWSAWGPCNVPCGTGTQKRTRLTTGEECPYNFEEQACNDQPCADEREMTVKHKQADERAEDLIERDFTEQKQELSEFLKNQEIEMQDAKQDPDALFKAQQDAEDVQQTLETMEKESNSLKDLKANEAEIDTENHDCHPEFHCKTCDLGGDKNDCLSCIEGATPVKSWSDSSHQYFSCKPEAQVGEGGNQEIDAFLKENHEPPSAPKMAAPVNGKIHGESMKPWQMTNHDEAVMHEVGNEEAQAFLRGSNREERSEKERRREWMVRHHEQESKHKKRKSAQACTSGCDPECCACKIDGDETFCMTCKPGFIANKLDDGYYDCQEGGGGEEGEHEGDDANWDEP